MTNSRPACDYHTPLTHWGIPENWCLKKSSFLNHPFGRKIDFTWCFPYTSVTQNLSTELCGHSVQFFVYQPSIFGVTNFDSCLYGNWWRVTPFRHLAILKASAQGANLFLRKKRIVTGDFTNHPRWRGPRGPPKNMVGGFFWASQAPRLPFS